MAKGENGKYTVVIWNNGKRSFSLTTDNGVTEDEIHDFIKSLAVMSG